LILDTSAILAIALREPEREQLLTKLGAADVVGIGAPTLVESSIVLSSRLGDSGARWLERLVERTGTVVISFEREHSQRAVEAWLRFGRGRHPAALNLGDCYSYATAKVAGRPLLCTGDDFAQTDLALA
jgi:ribonuclease VapC